METSEALAWVLAGNLRRSVLILLSERSMLSTEIADRLEKHRSAVSRTLSDLTEVKLVDLIKSRSRSRMYRLTTQGEDVASELRKRLAGQ